MKYTKEQHQKSRDKFLMGLVIAFLIIVCIALSTGCRTLDGFRQDVHNITAPPTTQR